jgi:hypothetical protein
VKQESRERGTKKRGARKKKRGCGRRPSSRPAPRVSPPRAATEREEGESEKPGNVGPQLDQQHDEHKTARAEASCPHATSGLSRRRVPSVRPSGRAAARRSRPSGVNAVPRPSVLGKMAKSKREKKGRREWRSKTGVENEDRCTNVSVERRSALACKSRANGLTEIGRAAITCCVQSG